VGFWQPDFYFFTFAFPMNTNKTDRLHWLLLILIMVVAGLLRFWDYIHLPFMWDELSAMSRTVYDNFRDLIRYGVVENDTHPAGVQVFMYYWIKLFGEAEWIVKLPFVLAGWASVWLSYLIAKLWFNRTAAILTATYVASLQLFVLYSQLARPYASGLFLTLLMVWFWSRYFLKGYKITDLVLFVLFAAMSGYNHHFSLLFAAIVGFSGLWFVKKEKRTAYMLAGVAIFVLYIPHLPIFLAQLQKGGIGGWLAKPSPWFLFQFFDWLMHYSVWTVLVLVMVFLTLTFTGRKVQPSRPTGKIRLLMLIWFLLPVIIGYAYSVTVEPIIQYSLLIFTTPYLLMVLFSFVRDAKPKYLVTVVILILAVNTLTLIFKRQHYKVLYKQAFQHVVEDALALNKQYPGDVLMVDDYIPYYSEYYFRKFGRRVPYFTVRNKGLSTVQFDSVMGSVKQNRVITCGLNKDYFQIVKKYFPYLIDYDRGFTFEEYTYSRIPDDSVKAIEPMQVASTDFKNSTGNWRFRPEHVEIDTVGHRTVYHQFTGEKYGPRCMVPLEKIAGEGYVFFDLRISVKPLTDSCSALLVAQLERDGKRVSWKGMKFAEFGLQKGRWQDVYLTLNIQDALKNRMNLEDCKLRVFIWNPGHSDFLVRDFQIEMRPGNPYRYALFFNFNDK